MGGCCSSISTVSSGGARHYPSLKSWVEAFDNWHNLTILSCLVSFWHARFRCDWHATLLMLSAVWVLMAAFLWYVLDQITLPLRKDNVSDNGANARNAPTWTRHHCSHSSGIAKGISTLVGFLGGFGLGLHIVSKNSHCRLSPWPQEIINSSKLFASSYVGGPSNYINALLYFSMSGISIWPIEFLFYNSNLTPS